MMALFTCVALVACSGRGDTLAPAVPAGMTKVTSTAAAARPTRTAGLGCGVGGGGVSYSAYQQVTPSQCVPCPPGEALSRLQGAGWCNARQGWSTVATLHRSCASSRRPACVGVQGDAAGPGSAGHWSSPQPTPGMGCGRVTCSVTSLRGACAPTRKLGPAPELRVKVL